MRQGRAAAAAAGLGAMLLASWPAAAEPVEELHIMHAGGLFGEALAKCVDEPLFAEQGIRIVVETPGGFAKLNAQAEAGTVVNVVTDLPTGEFERAKAMDLLAPLDWAAIDPAPMFPEAQQEFAYGQSYFSTIMAWRSDAPAPTNWVDFFDTETFPGKRALPDYPDFILPFAALGDGVPVDQLFPLDLDRAFKTLDRVKDDTIWWQAGAQAPQLLQDNEAQYAISWSGRVVGQEGVDVSFNQGMLDLSWFGVAKGATPEQMEAVYAWFHDQTLPEKQACMAEVVSYPGSSTELEPLLPQDRLDQFPTYSANKAVQWLPDAKWWFDNAAEVESRWNEFKLQQ